MLETFLMSRRKKLGMPTRTLVRISGVPVATVNRILTNPARVRFEYVAAVARVLGVDMEAGKTVPLQQLLKDRALIKASYVAKLIQGTQALEASALDQPGYERLIAVSTAALLAGKKRKLWDDD